MSHLWFPLADCPEQGRRLEIKDQAVWSQPLDEFELNAVIAQPMRAELFIQAHKDGLLIQGRLQGSVTLPCDRCAEPMTCILDSGFDIFESFEGGEDQEEDTQRFRQGKQGLELDLGAVLWEQFVLALPVKPLCSENCLGICPQCGANLNKDACGCDRSSLDPRLEVLRRLKVYAGYA